MVVSQVMYAGCVGWSPEGRKEEQNLDDLYDYGDATSWLLVMPSDWVPVAEYSDPSLIGANVTFTLRRKSTNAHTWTLRIVNNL